MTLTAILNVYLNGKLMGK